MIEEKLLGKRARQLLENDHYRVVFHQLYGYAIKYKVMWNDDELDVDARHENDILIDYQRSE
jgi:hypothetical protein